MLRTLPDFVDGLQQALPLPAHGRQIVHAPLRDRVVLPGRHALAALLPEGRQISLPQQAAQKGVDRALLGRQNGPPLQAADYFIAVAGALLDHQQNAELQGPSLDLGSPVVDVHSGSPPRECIVPHSTSFVNSIFLPVVRRNFFSPAPGPGAGAEKFSIFFQSYSDC